MSIIEFELGIRIAAEIWLLAALCKYVWSKQ